MVRRKFLSLMTLAGMSGLATVSAAKAAGEKHEVFYKVDGFTCVTCAVGLETLLQREKGVLAAKATYPEGKATVTYDPKITSESSILETIESMGFKAHRMPSAAQP